MKLEKILVTTDFSDNARKAYPCAADLARRFGAQLHLVHFAGIFPAVLTRDSEAEHLSMLDQALRAEATTHPALRERHVVPHLVSDRWTPEQLRAIEQSASIDLLVMATHGRTGFRHFVLGSFAERVIRNSSVPVCVCRDEATLVPKTVVVPFDFSEASRAALPAVRLWAQQFSAHFRFVYIYEPLPPPHIPLVQAIRDFLKATPRQPIEERFATLKDEDLAGVEADLEICEGEPSQEIARVARELNAELVIVGTHGVLGSVAQNVTRSVPCSVLTVPVPPGLQHDASRI